MVDHGCRGRVGPRVFGEEAASVERGDPEQREQVGRRGGSLNYLGHLAANQRSLPLPLEGAHRGEHTSLLPPHPEVGCRDREEFEVALGVPRPEPHQRSGIGVGKGSEEHAVRNAEHRGVGPDAEGHRECHDEREAGIRRDRAQREAQVLGERIQPKGASLPRQASAGQPPAFVAHGGQAAEPASHFLLGFGRGHSRALKLRPAWPGGTRARRLRPAPGRRRRTGCSVAGATRGTWDGQAGWRVAWMTFAIAAANWVQLSISARSARRPSGVSV